MLVYNFIWINMFRIKKNKIRSGPDLGRECQEDRPCVRNSDTCVNDRHNGAGGFKVSPVLFEVD